MTTLKLMTMLITVKITAARLKTKITNTFFVVTSTTRKWVAALITKTTTTAAQLNII